MSSPVGARRLLVVLAVLLQSLVVVPTLAGPARAQAATAPGFRDVNVLGGLTLPTAARFAPDGRVFVAEKSGVIKVFSNLEDPTPTVFADLRDRVHDYWDRGLLGLALPPDFPQNPWVYVLYAHGAPPAGSGLPTWGDDCPTPPGPNTDGCTVTGRLSRLQAAGDVMTGAEQVLITDWCQQFPSHSVGDLAFGPDGALYVSGGDGASYEGVDYGQLGNRNAGFPANPCGDPPGARGTALAPPTAAGGALRSQSLRRSGGPAVLGGTILRIDPTTGAGLPTNPLAGSADANARRIIATGLRNPFRFALRPGTGELWLGDVGWNSDEEVNRVADVADGVVENFGWPCYEGTRQQSAYAALGLSICSGLYSAAGSVTAPVFGYDHRAATVAGDGCSLGGSISGMAFDSGTRYPAAYAGALFFADYSRNCIWAMQRGADGNPSAGRVSVLVTGAPGPVNLQTGPDGLLYYVSITTGSLHRVEYTDPAPPPPEPPPPSEPPPPAEPPPPSEPPPADPSVRYVSDLTAVSAGNGWGPVERDRSNGEAAAGDGGVLTLQGRAFARGLGVHAASDVRYVVPSGCAGFRATVGVDDEVGAAGSVVFEVWDGATRRYASPVLTGSSASVAVDVAVTAGAQLRLVVAGTADGVDFDHADWADARLVCGGTTSPPPPPEPPPGNRPPVPTITAPGGSLRWKVGDTIAFRGAASDPEDGAVPAARLTWTLVQRHCPSGCHSHPVNSWTGESGSFVVPSYDFPSHLELRLTATDSAGAQASRTVRLDPQTVVLTFDTNPGGLKLSSLTSGSESVDTPFSVTVIVGSNVVVSAPEFQDSRGRRYFFQSWSDGGARTHTITAPATATEYTARYRR